MSIRSYLGELIGVGSDAPVAGLCCLDIVKAVLVSRPTLSHRPTGSAEGENATLYTICPRAA